MAFAVDGGWAEYVVVGAVGLTRVLTAEHRNRCRAIHLGMCPLGYGLNFVGFTTLMTYVCPALRYIGMFLAVVLGAAWWHRSRIEKETGRRVGIRDILTARDDPRQEFGADEEAELQQHASDSNIDDEAIVDAVEDDMDDDDSDDDRGDTDGSGGSSGSKDARRDGDVASTRG
ncbi:hypothetical protein MOPEL_135_00080 [Mobilicoccus pelagius NBRC 104925]|uniref:Uncharacterized protein n=2 Tax=Mobilicoccus TaxID=984996 RepID=H5UVL2_9MICO|nr:hypothetical protein MOPEL_135_00080 [Mobilicoccus pelagius NBRC 104925]